MVIAFGVASAPAHGPAARSSWPVAPSPSGTDSRPRICGSSRSRSTDPMAEPALLPASSDVARVHHPRPHRRRGLVPARRSSTTAPRERRRSGVLLPGRPGAGVNGTPAAGRVRRRARHLRHGRRRPHDGGGRRRPGHSTSTRRARPRSARAARSWSPARSPTPTSSLADRPRQRGRCGHPGPLDRRGRARRNLSHADAVRRARRPTRAAGALRDRRALPGPGAGAGPSGMVPRGEPMVDQRRPARRVREVRVARRARRPPQQRPRVLGRCSSTPA